MLKKILSIGAAVAFVLTIGVKVVDAKFQLEQKWFYMDDTTKSNPRVTAVCNEDNSEDCAQLFHRTSPSSPWQEVLVDGKPVIEKGIRDE